VKVLKKSLYPEGDKMKSSKWIYVLTVYALFILIALGNMGGCETTESGEDNDTDLRTCDLTGADSSCLILSSSMTRPAALTDGG
jgi:hypothetical protein